MTTYRYTPSSGPYSLLQKLNPAWWLGNVDDPLPPDDYEPGNPKRVSDWYWRNPGHNFTFYVIGIADRTFTRYGKEPDSVFANTGNWNWAIIFFAYVIPLPFIAYQSGNFKFYISWRERGNFGLKLTF